MHIELSYNTLYPRFLTQVVLNSRQSISVPTFNCYCSHALKESFVYLFPIEKLIQMKIKNILLGFCCVVVGGSDMASLRHLRSRLECPGGLVRPRYVMLYTSMTTPPRLPHVTSSVTSVPAAVIHCTQKLTYPVCTLAKSIVQLTFIVNILIIFILLNTYLHNCG